jgi:hypothetical protein
MRLTKAPIVLFCLLLLHGCGTGSQSPNRPGLPTRAEEDRFVCRTNMQNIANDVLTERSRMSLADYGVLITAGVTTSSLPELQAVPVCPDSGAYTLAKGHTQTDASFKVICNVPGHGSFEPGIDTQ